MKPANKILQQQIKDTVELIEMVKAGQLETINTARDSATELDSMKSAVNQVIDNGLTIMKLEDKLAVMYRLVGIF